MATKPNLFLIQFLLKCKRNIYKSKYTYTKTDIYTIYNAQCVQNCQIIKDVHIELCILGASFLIMQMLFKFPYKC